MVAPAGTVALISEPKTIVKATAVQLKLNARRARQICAEDSDGRSNVARGGLCFQQFVDEV